jgi:hypothetical protein
VLQDVNGADVKRMLGSTYYQWNIMSTDGHVQKAMGAGVAITDSTGLLFYCGGFGWGAIYHDYKKFHDRMVGRKVGVGSPEVTAQITTLEDLQDTPKDFFDAQAAGPSVNPIDIVLVSEPSLRRNLLTTAPVTWPPLKDGPVQGTLTTQVVVDRAGKVREISTIVADNPAIDDAARQVIAAMAFKPYLVDGTPVEVLSRITMPFNTTRP